MEGEGTGNAPPQPVALGMNSTAAGPAGDSILTQEDGQRLETSHTECAYPGLEVLESHVSRPNGSSLSEYVYLYQRWADGIYGAEEVLKLHASLLHSPPSRPPTPSASSSLGICLLRLMSFL